jgi:hypothetical protein
MARAGTIISGEYQKREGSREVTSTGPYQTFIYIHPDLHSIISLGLCPENTCTSNAEEPLPLTKPPHRLTACFSCVPLERVNIAQVFIDDDTQRCRGVLVEYTDGSQRTLGECRLGSDQPVTYAQPMQVCFHTCKNLDNHSWVDKIRFHDESQAHGHDESNWACSEMKGVMECWFTATHLQLTVISDELRTS